MHWFVKNLLTRLSFLQEFIEYFTKSKSPLNLSNYFEKLITKIILNSPNQKISLQDLSVTIHREILFQNGHFLKSKIPKKKVFFLIKQSIFLNGIQIFDKIMKLNYFEKQNFQFGLLNLICDFS